LIRSTVARNIRGDLCSPVVRVGAFPELLETLTPASAVPKITVAKNDHARTAKHNVGLPREIGGMLSVSQSATPKLLTQK